MVNTTAPINNKPDKNKENISKGKKILSTIKRTEYETIIRLNLQYIMNLVGAKIGFCKYELSKIGKGIVCFNPHSNLNYECDPLFSSNLNELISKTIYENTITYSNYEDCTETIKFQKSDTEVFINNILILPVLLTSLDSLIFIVSNKVPAFTSKDIQLLNKFKQQFKSILKTQIKNTILNNKKTELPLINRSVEGIITVNENLQIDFISSSLASLLGYMLSEIKGMHISKILKQNLTYFQQTGDHTIKNALIELKGRNNKSFSALVTIRNVLSEQGRNEGLSIIIEGNSKNNGAISNYSINHEKYLHKLANSSHIIFELDEDGNFIYCNNRFFQKMGYKPEQVINNLNIYQIISPGDRERLINNINENKERLEIIHDEYTALKSWVLFMPIELTLIPTMGNGKSNGWFGIIEDRTKQKRDYSETLRMHQKQLLEHHLTSIGEMAAGIAHEVNNPLASIVLYSQLLLEQKLPDQIKRDVKVINECAIQATNVIRGLLVFARQQLHQKTAININDLILVTLELRRYSLDNLHIEVITELATDLPPIMADPSQIQQVFLNLLINAEKAISSKSNEGQIIIKSELVNNYIRIAFSDNGPGISEENLNKIFNPFFTTREVGEGTGLGLSICHGIISEHGGHIYAKSQLGYGATFYVELPVIEIVETEKEDNKEQADKYLEGNNKRLKILIVDDDHAILDVLTKLLIREGHEVKTVDNSNDAFNIIITEVFDCILLDIKMPVMSGIELYNRVKNLKSDIVNKIIFITGDSADLETRGFLESNNIKYYLKPFIFKELRDELISKFQKN